MSEKSKPEVGKIIKIIQSVLCILYVIFMSAQAINIYFAGAAAKAADPRAVIYTSESVSAAVINGLPIFILLVITTLLAFILGIKNTEKPFYAPGSKKHIAAVRAEMADNRYAKKINKVRCFLIAVSAALVLAGIGNGSAKAVLAKAVVICTECVGLG